ncbi:MAG TPA: hypothetical protein VEY70_22310 [Metabacillus sp.]|nr:hypothetical protein [Metabacillus sp.]
MESEGSPRQTFIVLAFEIAFINALFKVMDVMEKNKPEYNGKLSEKIRLFLHGLKKSRFEKYSKRRKRNLFINSLANIILAQMTFGSYF